MNYINIAKQSNLSLGCIARNFEYKTRYIVIFPYKSIKPYEEKLRKLKLPSLENRHIWTQLSEVSKIINVLIILFKNLFEQTI